MFIHAFVQFIHKEEMEMATPKRKVSHARTADIQLLQMSPVGGRAGSPGYYSGPESRGLTVGIKKK